MYTGKKVIRNFTFLLLTAVTVSTSIGHAQTVYASLKSGNWNAGDVWETYSNLTAAMAATAGNGTPSTSTTNPGGTHFVYIRPGHTISMGDANRGCKGIYIAAGGKLSGASNTAERRLQIGAGGTGFAYPLIDTVWVDGTLGGPTEKIYIETGAAAAQVKMFGNGTVDLNRIRTIGGATGGTMNFDIDINTNLWIEYNYALSLVRSPAITDNYTMTIFPNKTVTIKAATATFHNTENVTTYGNYTYLIKGLLDAGVTNTSSVIAPASAASSKIALTIDGGTFRTGYAFKADTSKSAPVSTGLLDFKIINGGTYEAAGTFDLQINKTTTNGGAVKDVLFQTDGTSTITRSVGYLGEKFPFGIGTSNNTARLLNRTMVGGYTVKLKSTLDNPAPDPAKIVNRQWTVTKMVSDASLTEVSLTWLGADQAAGFDPAGSVCILRWTGVGYEAHPAIVTGSGTLASPYVATATDFTALSPLIVANFTAVPVYFETQRAFQKNAGIQVEWKVATQSNSNQYHVEKSSDGRNFTTAATITVVRGSYQTDFSWFDAAPFTGNNYYRIRAKDDQGEVKLTPVMRVNLGRGAAVLSVYPDPVENHILNLQFSNLTPGNYNISLYSTSGQRVFYSLVHSEGGALSESIRLPATVSSGMYSLQVAGGIMKESRVVSVR